MNTIAQTYPRRRREGRGAPGLRTGIVLMTALLSAGCSTHLGYVPHDVYAGSFWPNSVPKKSPDYSQVQNWAFNVSDGYDSRATANRQAVYVGGLTAVASASALVALASFAPTNPAIIGIPIGTTFLGGAMVLYNNEQKAVIYGYASGTIRGLLNRSECRKKKGSAEEDEAVCLRAEVSAVMRKVDDHITLLDPKNVADRLKAVGQSTGAKKVSAQQKKDAAKDAADALKNAKAKTPPDKKEIDELQEASDKAAKAAESATAEATKARAENTVESLSAEANDFSDLKELPDPPSLCQTQAECELPGE